MSFAQPQRISDRKEIGNAMSDCGESLIWDGNVAKVLGRDRVRSLYFPLSRPDTLARVGAQPLCPIQKMWF